MQFFTIFSTLLLTASALPAPHKGEHPPTYTIPGSDIPTVPSGHPTKFTPYLFRFPRPSDGSAIVNTEEILTSLQPHGFNRSHLHHKFSATMNGFAADMSEHCVKILKAMLPASGVIIEPIVTYKVQAPLATPQLADSKRFIAENRVKNPRQAPAPGITSLQTQTNAPWGLQRISQKKMISIGSNASPDKVKEPIFSYTFDETAGEGVDIYVIDTGVNVDHVSFGGRAKRVFTAESLKQDPLDGEEDHAGHGTHCAGTTGSRGFGVAKKARIHAIKVMGRKGSGSSSDIVAGIDFMLDSHRKRSKEADFKGSVASLSFGLDADESDPNSRSSSPILERAIMKANLEGIHVVIAAGNQGIDACRVSPSFLSNAIYNGTNLNYAAHAITVGATDIYDNRADFSNYGPCITTYAPGQDILSTYIGGTEATESLSGTSMAAPHVAGLVAYYLGQDQSLRTDIVAMKKKIMNTSWKGLLHNIKDSADSKILAFNGV
ncbi:hypothetical protein TWF718_007206 [Orbilia javanica]|uniref:Peptidase S8/S53 domain-containing protein n=1 Tax=Orbilia javanica TaxID=47235 RepID=A0AAN8RDP0_9PEZI